MARTQVAPSITIGGIRYPFWFDRTTLSACGVRGQYLGDEQKVLLDIELPRTTQLRTIFHEAMHGIFSVSTLKAGGTKDQEMDDILEEKVCTLLEREIPELFKANPYLLEVCDAPVVSTDGTPA